MAERRTDTSTVCSAPNEDGSIPFSYNSSVSGPRRSQIVRESGAGLMYPDGTTIGVIHVERSGQIPVVTATNSRLIRMPDEQNVRIDTRNQSRAEAQRRLRAFGAA
jgi:hypothetical protein